MIPTAAAGIPARHVPGGLFLSRCRRFLPLLMLPLPAAPLQAAERPNIVVILADDLGSEALGCYGGRTFLGRQNAELGPVKTPCLDALAREGMLFRWCFATPVCSPSRAQLLTGRYNHRIGFPDIQGRSGAVAQLDPRAHPTVAMRLREAGYATGVVGKWHIGPAGTAQDTPTSPERDTDHAHPRACGFERQCVFGAPHLRIYGKPVAGAYTPDVFQAWALRFIEEQAARKRPFFLYYASPLPHFPYWPTPLNPDGPTIGEGKLGEMYGDMRNFPFLVEYLDGQVGELVARLDAAGLTRNTLVIFAGDNGTPPWLHTRMADGTTIAWGKGTMKDTGSRVPLIARWPGVVAAGSECDGLVDFSDLMPTLLDLAGVKPEAEVDGLSFSRTLRDRAPAPRTWVHSLFKEEWFVRDGGWKLRENGALFDVSGSPMTERLVAPADETDASRAARARLGAVADRLHPATPAGR